MTSVGGNDFEKLDDGCFLVSCSSKDVEFDLDTLNNEFEKKPLMPKVDQYTSKKTDKKLFLLGEGGPINFLNGAVFGPALSLVQAELILAIKQIADEKVTGDLVEVENDERKEIASIWEGMFIDPATGSFFY